MAYSKSVLVYSIFITQLVNFVAGASIHSSALKDEDLESKEVEDMKVVASDELPDFSRENLVKILQKSQYFQDIFSEQPDPMTIQFGHVCENPNEWEQRYEQRDFNKNHYQGKMRWGNKNGDYGEHYWDLGHAG